MSNSDWAETQSISNYISNMDRLNSYQNQDQQQQQQRGNANMMQVEEDENPSNWNNMKKANCSNSPRKGPNSNYMLGSPQGVCHLDYQKFKRQPSHQMGVEGGLNDLSKKLNLNNNNQQQKEIDDECEIISYQNSSKRIKDNECGQKEILDYYKYDLCGVVNHIGSTIQRGHYISLCKSLKDPFDWYKFDDESVDKIYETGNIIDANAYILFYAKNKTGLNQNENNSVGGNASMTKDVL